MTGREQLGSIFKLLGALAIFLLVTLAGGLLVASYWSGIPVASESWVSVPTETPSLPILGPLPTPEPSVQIIVPEETAVATGMIPTVLFLPTDVPTTVAPTMGIVPAVKMIVVDLSEQWLYAYEGEVLFLETPVSTGRDATPTPLGTYSIYLKLVVDAMSGPGYYLPDVPHTMYFYDGYAIHGAYWHDNFGQEMSHGCVNLPLDVAEKLFYWADPILSEGETYVYANADNLGTVVVIRE